MKKYQLILLSILSGLLLSVAWPARGFPALLFVALIPLLYVEDYIINHRSEFRTTSIFLYSYITFVIWNVLTTWWVLNSTVPGGLFAILANSFLMAFTFTVFHFTHRVFIGFKGYLGLITCWVTYEYLHLDWDLTWSWLNLGNGFASQHTWIQWYEFTGVFGGTVWALTVNILLFSLMKQLLSHKRSYKQIRIFSIITVCFIVVPVIISFFIYCNYEENGKPIEVIVVQPNIDPWNEKFGGTSTDEQLNKMLHIAKKKLCSTTDFLVFPETALPESTWEDQFIITDSYLALKKIIASYPNLKIVIGASTFKMFRHNEKRSITARKYNNDTISWYDAYNTAIFIDSSKNIQLYHKSKLVPGVEKMPFAKYLGFLEKYSIDLGGMKGSYGTQENRDPFDPPISHIKVTPVICYESIYGEFVSKYMLNGAQLIFIITNDGWWGDTPGYKQHFEYARLRAIETRRSVARSANTGISGFFNQRGDVLQYSKWAEPNDLKQKIYTNTSMTFYVKHGDYIGKICMWFAWIIIFSSIVIKFISLIK